MKISEGMPHIDDARKENLVQFAPYVAILPWFNSNVLHKLYINVYKPLERFTETYAVRAITCADMLQSPNVKRIRHNVFVMDTLLQDELRLQMQSRQEILKRLGLFMLAYTQECRRQFHSSTYLESYRIEGNLILNPSLEAGRISRHIADRLNQVKNFSQKKNSVGYYLSVLEKENVNEQQAELIKFLKGYQDYHPDSPELPDAWKHLKDFSQGTQNSISIKIPNHVKTRILSEITGQTGGTAVPKLHSLIIGIDSYTDTRIFPLISAVNDSQKIKTFIKENIAGDKLHDCTTLLDKEATRQAIIHNLEELSTQSKPGDTFVFYFAGYGGMEQTGPLGTQPVYSNQNVSFVMNRYLACYDSDTTTRGLALSELEYLLSKFPSTCEHIVILDCSFQREANLRLSPNQKIRSLAWSEPPRLKEEFVWSNISQDYPQVTFNGIVLYAAEEENNAYEEPIGGFFTTTLIEGIGYSENQGTYADLFAAIKPIEVESVIQNPRFETKGNFDPTRVFLDGFMKIPEVKLTSFFIENGMDADELKNQAVRYLSEKPGAFIISEVETSAQYRLKWMPQEMWICQNDDVQRPVTYIDISEGNAILTTLQYFAHISRWELLRSQNYSGSKAADNLELVIRQMSDNNQFIPVTPHGNVVRYEYDSDWNGALSAQFQMDIFNKGNTMVYCTLLYLSNTFEISSRLFTGNAGSIHPQQGNMVNSGNAITMEMAQHVLDFNHPECEFYMKLIADNQPFDVYDLEQPPLPIPRKPHQKAYAS